MPDREYFNNRRKNRRAKYIAMLGGKCDQCDAIDGLHFDHKDPNKKEFKISDKIDAPEEILLKEINKCRLLCGPCHRKKTKENNEHGQNIADHGTLHYYKQYKCRCDKCRKHMSEYNKTRRKMNIVASININHIVNRFKLAAAIKINPLITIMAEILNKTDHSPLINKLLNQVLRAVNNNDFSTAFDMLKVIGNETNKDVHPNIIELARIIATNKRNSIVT